MEIYSNNKVGVVLDQTQPTKCERSDGSKVVWNNILKQLIKVNNSSQKYGLTLTFRSSFNLDDPLILHRVTEEFMNKYNAKFQYIGFAEFTKRGNIHYHLVIWDCYLLPLISFCKAWQRKFGIYRLEDPIKYYYCLNIKQCNIKRIMLRPKKESKCWLHYIIKNHPSGLWPLTNY